MQKITELSPRQWAEINLIRSDWLKNASRKPEKKDVELAVSKLYSLNNLPPPKIIYVDSPLSALITKKIIGQDSLGDSLHCSIRDSLGVSSGGSLQGSLWDSLRGSIGDSIQDSLGVSLLDSIRDSLLGSLRDLLWDSLLDSLRGSLGDWLDVYWQQSYSAFLEGGHIAGVVYDRQKYEDYQIICKNLSFVLPYKSLCIVAAPPIYCGWDDDGRIHGDDRAAVEYADGFKIWAIEGIRVPESVVLRSELQTIDEINQEQNEEVKRIRINRFGWDKYLAKSNAIVLDFWTSPNGFLESLMRCGDYTILCTYDPSTGRPYSLEVDPSCEKCGDAQQYLLAPKSALAGLGIECKSTYPTIRT